MQVLPLRIISVVIALVVTCELQVNSALAQNVQRASSSASELMLQEPVLRPLWVCKGDLAPEGYAITATGPGHDCAGECNGLYAEVLRDQMVICQNQPIPDDFELVGSATSPRCACVAARENALVIRRRIVEPTY
jgi:hypothetical protein